MKRWVKAGDIMSVPTGLGDAITIALAVMPRHHVVYEPHGTRLRPANEWETAIYELIAGNMGWYNW